MLTWWFCKYANMAQFTSLLSRQISRHVDVAKSTILACVASDTKYYVWIVNLDDMDGMWQKPWSLLLWHLMWHSDVIEIEGFTDMQGTRC